MPLHKLILISLIAGLLLPGFCLAQEKDNKMPQTVEEAKSVGLNILKELPAATKKVWDEEAWPLFLKMWDWAQGPWNTYVKPYIETGWQKFLGLLGRETPDIKEEFQKEKEIKWCPDLLIFTIFRLSPAHKPADIPNGLSQSLLVFHKGDSHIIFASFTKGSARSDCNLGMFHQI